MAYISSIERMGVMKLSELSTCYAPLYPNLEAELRRHGYKRAAIADVTGVCLSAATDKMRRPNRLTVAEARRIRDTLFPALTLDYLFFSDQNK